jgi:hypothetical protein
MRADTHSGKLTTGGRLGWTVKASDQEARRLQRRAEQASKRLLALLERFHEYGQGERKKVQR